ncbi:MAG: hypothetical protein LBC77_08000 [Spirochaetaceae bacterium]|jgi:outer membrane protein assembly factor BamD (BamD/ComL family)|nr:hypothetical protein [Spirochaetaceae bacterium]
MNIKRFALASSLCLAAVSGCASGPISVPEDSSAEEVIQLAQEAMDKDRYKLAIQYYEAVIDRFSFNAEAVCDAEYGIALVHYKQKKYDLAKEEYSALLDKYTGAQAAKLPKKYQVLSKIGLEKIAEKQKFVATE